MPSPQISPALTIRAIRAVGVEVPMTYVLGTSRGRIAKAPLLLIDVETAEGVTGRAYLWSYFPRAMVAIASLLKEVEDRTKGERVDPQALGILIVGSEPFDVVGGVAVRCFGNAVERTLDLVEADQKRTGQ